MAQMFHRILLSAGLLLIPASQAVAASFSLPDDAVIEVRNFSFPAMPDGDPDRNLADEFHEQIIVALQRAGVTVLHADSADETASRTDIPAPLIVTPLPPPESGSAPPPEENGKNGDARENDGKDTDTDEESADTGGIGAPSAPPALPGVSSPYVSPPDVSPSPRARTVATHILEGRVTLFTETVGNPARIGGGIRIRTESMLRCAYKIKDAGNGNVIISDVSSGSSARVTTQTRDIDSVLATLSAKAMTTAAVKIAVQLSGGSVPGTESSPDRSYYQDSPGKRLKTGR